MQLGEPVPSTESTRGRDVGPERDRLHQIAQVGLVRVEAAVRDGLAPGGSRGAVDREPVAAGPALGEVRLPARKRQDAAAVERAEVGAVQLVGDVEVARRGRRVRRADRNADPRARPLGVVHRQLRASRGRPRATIGRLQQPQLLRARPARPGGSPARGCGLATQSPFRNDDGERLRRAELGSRADRRARTSAAGRRRAGPRSCLSAPGRRSRGRARVAAAGSSAAGRRGSRTRPPRCNRWRQRQRGTRTATERRTDAR